MQQERSPCARPASFFRVLTQHGHACLLLDMPTGRAVPLGRALAMASPRRAARYMQDLPSCSAESQPHLKAHSSVSTRRGAWQPLLLTRHPTCAPGAGAGPGPDAGVPGHDLHAQGAAPAGGRRGRRIGLVGARPADGAHAGHLWRGRGCAGRPLHHSPHPFACQCMCANACTHP